MSEKRKLYMKYFVLKMDDRIDIYKLYECIMEKESSYPKIRQIAQDILDCLIPEEKKHV